MGQEIDVVPRHNGVTHACWCGGTMMLYLITCPHISSVPVITHLCDRQQLHCVPSSWLRQAKAAESRRMKASGPGVGWQLGQLYPPLVPDSCLEHSVTCLGVTHGGAGNHSLSFPGFLCDMTYDSQCSHTEQRAPAHCIFISHLPCPCTPVVTPYFLPEEVISIGYFD